MKWIEIDKEHFHKTMRKFNTKERGQDGRFIEVEDTHTVMWGDRTISKEFAYKRNPLVKIIFYQEITYMQYV